MNSTNGTTIIAWDKIWDDMPYKKSQVKVVTTVYTVVAEDKE